jgi:hypothetical protein
MIKSIGITLEAPVLIGEIQVGVSVMLGCPNVDGQLRAVQ